MAKLMFQEVKAPLAVIIRELPSLKQIMEVIFPPVCRGKPSSKRPCHPLPYLLEGDSRSPSKRRSVPQFHGGR